VGQFKSSQATLRVIGDALLPDEVTKLFGREPSACQRKGERFVGPKTGSEWTAKTGMWRLEATEREPEELSAQIDELLGKLPGSLDVWAKIRETSEIDLFVGLFMSSGNNGLSIAPAQLLALGERGIELVMDVYDPSED
jgi:hypothetical protein